MGYCGQNPSLSRLRVLPPPKVLEFNHIDCPLAIGYMLAMPTRQAYDTFRRTIRYSSDDYGRWGGGACLDTTAKRKDARSDVDRKKLRNTCITKVMCCVQRSAAGR